MLPLAQRGPIGVNTMDTDYENKIITEYEDKAGFPFRKVNRVIFKKLLAKGELDKEEMPCPKRRNCGSVKGMKARRYQTGGGPIIREAVKAVK